MRRFIKTFKNSIWGKILKFIFNIIKWALEILIIGLAIIIITQRVTNNQKAFLGFRIFNVATGSMEPEYAVGDILISKEKNPSEVKVGDNIVYLGKSGGYEGKIITHNVIAIEQNEQGEYIFHTKGRANTIEDPIVHEDQLYGTIVQNNEVLSFICKVLSSRYGLYFFVIIPIILYAFAEFVKVQGRKVEEERRLQEERRAHKPKKRPKEPEIIQDEEIQAEDIQEEKEIAEEVKASKKANSKGTGTKKKLKGSEPEEVEEETKKVKKTSKTVKKEAVQGEKTSKADKGEKVSKVVKEEKKTKNNKETRASKTTKAEKEVTPAKKTTRKKQAKDE